MSDAHPEAVNDEFGAEQQRIRSGSTEDLPDLLKVHEFLETFQIGRTSFYREVAQGRLRVLKFGTATRIARADAQAWAGRLPSPPSSLR